MGVTTRFKKALLSQTFWIDALALVISSIPYGMSIEIGFWHWTFLQSLSSRLGGIPADLSLGGPYGIWRSIVLKKMRSGQGRSWLWNWLAGSLAFASFQIPIYLVVIFATWLWIPIEKRATPDQILGACFTLVITSPIGDKLFAWTVIFLRWCFRVQNHIIKDKHEN